MYTDVFRTDRASPIFYTVSLKKTLMLHTITSMHINWFW